MSKKDHHNDKSLAAEVKPLLAPDAMTKLLLSIGLAAKYVETVLKNVKLANTFVEVCREAGVESKGCNEKVGAILNKLATSLLPEWELAIKHRPAVLKLVVEGKIKSNAQVDKVVHYFKKATKFDVAEFNEFCGVGVEISAAQITAEVKKQIGASGAGAGWGAQFKYVQEVNKALKWADGALVMAEVEAQLTAQFGKKEDAKQQAKPAAAPKGTAAPAAGAGQGAAAGNGTAGAEKKAPAAGAAGAAGSAVDAVDDFADSARDLKAARNTEEQRQRCLKATGGKVFTRFPPEPNGFLHIGHAKSMRLNFGVAGRSGGGCIMRFDDTNPEAEKKIYIDSIYDSLAWLGHKPVRVTYTSDYFPQLYDLAVALIKKGLAYVDHQTKDEIAKARSTKEPSPWRDRPVAESLRLFEDMRKGKFEEGAATLRMKGDLTSSNPQMWDMVAYRIKYKRHPHTGDKWCIYPSYDYSHCLIDSLEYITYSLCTLEFEVRRESYFWLLDVLDMYKPKVWEFSRLNITNNVMSKRKLKQLVMDKYVRGWDDPRLFTINGLRRRGYTADAINEFCDKVGVSRTANTIEIQLLEACARQNLDGIARRAMVVAHPLRVVLTNYDAKKTESFDAITLPKDKSTHAVTLSRVVYIDQSDFKLDAKAAEAEDFYGFTPNQPVRLKYAHIIRYKSCTRDASGRVTEVQVEVDVNDKTTRCKGNLHWVAEPRPGVEPTKVELRLYDRLFTSKDPGGMDGWLDDINQSSLEVVNGAYADVGVAGAKDMDKFQFERVGYFSCDSDSKDGHLVFNRTVKLKETEKLKHHDAPAAAGAGAGKGKGKTGGK